jgi:hypothetical protein
MGQEVRTQMNADHADFLTPSGWPIKPTAFVFDYSHRHPSVLGIPLLPLLAQNTFGISNCEFEHSGRDVI